MSLLAVNTSIDEFFRRHPSFKGAPVFAGLSGGLDSCVLLSALAQNIKPALISAIHIHHGLQDDADKFQAHCQALCKQLNIKLLVKKVRVEQGASIEAQARNARFKAFSEIVPKDSLLFLGHHQDDQIETFFMRLLRGSGLKGLAGMSEQQRFEPFFLARPLLSLSKYELKQYAQSQKISWIEDSTNKDTQFERNKIRHHLPYIWENFSDQNTQPQANVSRSISQLNKDYQSLLSLLEPHLKACIKPACYPQTASQCLDIVALSEHKADIQSLIIRQWLSTLGLYAPNQTQLDEIQASLIDAKVDAQPEYDYQKGQIVRHQGALYWIQKTPMPPDVVLDLTQPSGNSVIWLNTPINISNNGHIKAGCYRLCAASAVEQRELKTKNRGTKRFKQLFQEAKTPPWLRANWPVLLENDTPVALVGLAIAESVYSEKGWLLSYV